MQTDNYYKLDNPAWYSLTETHRHFATGNDMVKRYPETIAPFAALHPDIKDIRAGLDQCIPANGSFFLIGDIHDLNLNEPFAAPGYILESRLDCVQMISIEKIDSSITDVIEELGETDDDEMIALVNRVQPGYYNPGTRLMGDYYGIRVNGVLISMAGERMRMNGLTEISAVVTDPGFTGRGYAQQLVTHVANKNRAAAATPFLHVAATNERAIRLYEHLGFVKRRIIPFWKIKAGY
jgi:GNAT superfamily N-acetyltransferase